MKRLISILSLSLICFGCSIKGEIEKLLSSSPIILPLTQEGALQLMESKTNSCQEIWISDYLLPSSFDLQAGTNLVPTPEFDFWLIVATIRDYQYEYFFVNPSDGSYTSCIQEFKPHYEASEKFLSCVKAPHSEYRETIRSRKTRTQESYDPHLWAIIINGGADVANNRERYWNDCSEIYTTLVEDYNYNPDQISVLMSDGLSTGFDMTTENGIMVDSSKDLDGDGIYDIDCAATYENVDSVFTALSSLLTEEDQLFIFCSDHGERNTICSTLLLWDIGSLWATEFSDYLDNFDSGVRIFCVFNQCHSGGFIDEISRTNTALAASCAANQLVYGIPSNSNHHTHGPFPYYFISAVRGEYDFNVSCNADLNDDGHISFYEGYYHANQNTGTQSQVPQYSSSPQYIGSYYDLSGDLLLSGVSISGSNVISNVSPKTYSISNLPAGATVSWTADPKISLSSSSGSSVTAYSVSSNAYHANASITATVHLINQDVVLTKYVNLWYSGIVHDNSIISGGVYGTVGVFSLPSDIAGNQSYYWTSQLGLAEYQGYFFTEFPVLDPSNIYPYDITLTLTNPLGETTIIVKTVEDASMNQSINIQQLKQMYLTM